MEEEEIGRWGAGRENVQHLTYTLQKSKTKLREGDRKKKNSNSSKQLNYGDAWLWELQDQP